MKLINKVLAFLIRVTITVSGLFIKSIDFRYNRRMVLTTSLSGIYAAAVTPLDLYGNIVLDDWPTLLDFLAERGCHGALLHGTTGEGPAFTFDERIQMIRVALKIHESKPDFHLFIGTGTPSLEETARLTRYVFDLGVDGVVVLPPYFYRTVNDDGLFNYYSQVIRRAVPNGAAFLLYHLPSITHIPISFDLIARLLDAFPEHLIGIKDSSMDPEYARLLGARFSDSLLIFSGTDDLFTHALSNSACGSITALANVRSLDARAIWDLHLAGSDPSEPQTRLSATRLIMNRFPPNPPLYKALLHLIHGFPLWGVRPPLIQLSDDRSEKILETVLSEMECFAV